MLNWHLETIYMYMQTLYIVRSLFTRIFGNLGDPGDLAVWHLHMPTSSWNYAPQVKSSHEVQFPKPRYVVHMKFHQLEIVTASG